MMMSISEELDKLLNINKIELYKFLDQCINELEGKEEVNLDNFTKDSENKEKLKQTKDYIKTYYRTAVIQKDCRHNPVISERINEALKTCYNVRKSDIFQALAKEYILKKGYNLVDNFDWKLKWILGSSDIATIREPILQIYLHCSCQINDLQRSTINFEANLEKVDGLIETLTKVKQELESL